MKIIAVYSEYLGCTKHIHCVRKYRFFQSERCVCVCVCVCGTYNNECVLQA